MWTYSASGIGAESAKTHLGFYWAKIFRMPVAQVARELRRPSNRSPWIIHFTIIGALWNFIRCISKLRQGIGGNPATPISCRPILRRLLIMVDGASTAAELIDRLTTFGVTLHLVELEAGGIYRSRLRRPSTPSAASAPAPPEFKLDEAKHFIRSILLSAMGPAADYRIECIEAVTTPEQLRVELDTLRDLLPKVLSRQQAEQAWRQMEPITFALEPGSSSAAPLARVAALPAQTRIQSQRSQELRRAHPARHHGIRRDSPDRAHCGDYHARATPARTRRHPRHVAQGAIPAPGRTGVAATGADHGFTQRTAAVARIRQAGSACKYQRRSASAWPRWLSGF